MPVRERITALQALAAQTAELVALQLLTLVRALPVRHILRNLLVGMLVVKVHHVLHSADMYVPARELRIPILRAADPHAATAPHPVLTATGMYVLQQGYMPVPLLMSVKIIVAVEAAAVSPVT